MTKDGRRVDLDVLVLATGFNLWDANFPAIQVIGRDDRDLGKWWRDNRFCAYEGITVPRFPNFLSLDSPYSYSGLSYFTTIETQMAHMERLFTAMKKKDVDVFEVREEANDAFLDRMTEPSATGFNAGAARPRGATTSTSTARPCCCDRRRPSARTAKPCSSRSTTTPTALG